VPPGINPFAVKENNNNNNNNNTRNNNNNKSLKGLNSYNICSVNTCEVVPL
jgi:hypothetical protein